ncbi:MAG: BamA/TamA family outer membrane protein [Bacteroidota bacterium]|nr:BamA/TamA family outer membrane protein [Bacteroidota bacterium]
MKGSFVSIRWLIIVLLASGCTGLKYATPERPMFSDVKIEFTEEPSFDPDGARSELEGVVKPAPNNKILGMRPTVAIHNMVKEPEKQKGWKFFLKYRIGSEPVYLEDVPVDDIVAAMVNRMNNRGYFKAAVRSAVEHKERTASITFTVEPGKPHLLREITFDHTHAEDSLNALIAQEQPRSILKKGDAYDLNKITEERVRLSDILRNKGYYRFRDDDLIFAADSAIGGHLVDLHLHIKSTTFQQSLLRYTIGDVYIHGDRDEILPPQDTIFQDSVHYINYLNIFRPTPIIRGVFIKPGDHFSMRRTDWSQRYLSSFGVFRNTQIIYRDDSVKFGTLDADVLLAPQQRFTFSTELNAVSKSNNFAGPGVRVGFKDRGLFRGGEILNIDLTGRFEKQIGGPGQGTNAYEAGIKSSLQIPRLVFFDKVRRPRPNAPTTRIELGYTLFRRIGLYGLSSASASYNYQWRHNYHVWHDVQVPEISFNKLIFTSPEFDAFLGENRLIQRSFDEQFIFGVGYTYTRSNRTPRHGNKPYYTLTLGFDESGNVLNAFSAIGGDRPLEGYRLFNERYAQYVRFRPELRFYTPIGVEGDQIVSRLLVWSALPYGNSEVVPFVKQYFAGGPMSIRAFRARSVGPGSYVSDRESNLLVDQVGDLRLEANVEYRFTISGIFKAAVFSDAGNVWLLQEDPQRPGGKFNINTALQEIAFGAGAGIRIDPDFLVIRLDLAVPLRRPDMPRGERWIFDKTDEPVNRSPVLNIAIGYPF